jgi:hypothetical protein
MAKATSASPATSTKEPPLLGKCVPGLLLLAPAVGLKEALAVGLGEPLAEPLGEELAEALAEPLAPLTETVAIISGCILQWYAYVPG